FSGRADPRQLLCGRIRRRTKSAPSGVWRTALHVDVAHPGGLTGLRPSKLHMQALCLAGDLAFIARARDPGSLLSFREVPDENSGATLTRAGCEGRTVSGEPPVPEPMHQLERVERRP